METVSDFKRELKPGMKLTLLGADWNTMNGQTREVVRVRSTKFSLSTVTSRGVVESWVDFPKASVSVVTADSITFPRFDDAPEMGSITYRIEV